MEPEDPQVSAVNPFRCLLLDSAGLEAIWPDPSEEDLVDLASALVGSEPWQKVPQPAAVVVSHDPARLALLGRFGEADEARIEALRTQLDIARYGFRYVSYSEAERLATVVAERLAEHIGRSALQSARYVAIPRGGHVVLGMLAYAVGADSDQLEPRDAELWVVVDDCSISGARFLEWLDAHPGPEVVFAHLRSHPDLRKALEQHPRVRACIAAGDLRDHAPTRLGEGYEEWRASWENRDSGVWAGQTDRIAFTWNEPDTAMWNPVTHRVESGWHLVGPRRCLKNRQSIVDGAIQVLPRIEGELRPTSNTTWAQLSDEVVVADIASGTVLGLSGVGATMFLEAMSAPTLAEAIKRLTALYDVEPERLAADFEEFVAGLVAAGIVELSS
jgi:hypothetical protein